MKKHAPTGYIFCFVCMLLAIGAIFLALRGAWLAVGLCCGTIAALCVLQWALETRCPHCGRLGALRLSEKVPVHEEPVTLTETAAERDDAVRTNFQYSSHTAGVRTVYETVHRCRFCGKERRGSHIVTRRAF